MKNINTQELLTRKKFGELTAYIEELSKALINFIVKRDYDKVTQLLLSIEPMKHNLVAYKESLLKEEDKYEEVQLTSELVGRLNELSFLINNFSKQDVLNSIMENVDEVAYAYPILETVRRNRDSQINIEELTSNIRENEMVEVTSGEIENSLYSLNNLNMISVENGVARLSELGENFFSIYSANKKFTNKYEKIKRKSQHQRRMKVDLELLEKVETILNGFNMLQVMYNFSEEMLAVEEIADLIDLSLDEIETVLERLSMLKLIEKETIEDRELYLITKYGIKIFTLYRENKRYTNKYEKIQRREKKNSELTA